MTHPHFLEDVKQECLLFHIDETGKKVFDKRCFGKGYNLQQVEALKQNNQKIGIMYYIKDTNYAVVDIDTNDYSTDDLFNDTGIDSCYVKGNTKGFHIWMQFNGNKPDEFKKNIVNCGNHSTIDYLGEKVFEVVGKEWIGEEVCYLLPDQFIKCFKKNKFIKEKPEEFTINLPSNDVTKFADIIDVKYLDDRSDWVKIVLACKKCGVPEEEIRNISKKSSHYDDTGFDNVWNSYSFEAISLTEGTIRYYAKLSNKEAYNKLSGHYFFVQKHPALTDHDFATIFMEQCSDCIKYYDKTYYIYFNDEWKILSPKEAKAFLSIMLINTISDKLKKERLEICKTMNDYEADSPEYEKYKKMFNLTSEAETTVRRTNQLNNIVSMVKNMVETSGNLKEDIFDMKPYIFRFNNRSIDLRTGRDIEIKKTDYITQSTGKEWINPTAEQMKVIDNLFISIFPDEEVRKCYLSVLLLALTGIRQERLFIANGGGRNGKGLINELMFESMGNYAYKLPVELLIKDMNKTGANPQLASCDKKRFIISSEPPEGHKLQMAVIKDLTGGNEISARGLYSEKTRISMMETLLLECNKKPDIAGRIDSSVMERIVDIPFESTFVSNPNDVDESRKVYLANLEYKTSEWRKSHSNALFNYILKNAPKELYIPERVVKLSKAYVISSDETYNWVMDIYEVSKDENDVVKIKDLYTEYKMSDLYTNLSKAEKRKINKAYFTQMIKHHVSFKKVYRETKQTLNNIQFCCERIHFLKRRLDDDDDDTAHL